MTKEEFIRQAEAQRETMFRVSRAYLRRECDRADAVQEALLKAWRKLPGLREEAYFRTWLIRILIRECLNILKSQKNVVMMEEAPEAEAPAPPDHSALREAILALPSKLRIVIVLHYMEDCPTEDIARTLRISKGTVCSRLSRAREKLRDYLKEDDER